MTNVVVVLLEYKTSNRNRAELSSLWTLKNDRKSVPVAIQISKKADRQTTCYTYLIQYYSIGVGTVEAKGAMVLQ